MANARSTSGIANAIDNLNKSYYDTMSSPDVFASIVNGLNYQLTFGVPNVNVNSKSFIRNEEGFMFFMVGVDKIGLEARVTD